MLSIPKSECFNDKYPSFSLLSCFMLTPPLFEHTELFQEANELIDELRKIGSKASFTPFANNFDSTSRHHDNAELDQKKKKKHKKKKEKENKQWNTK